MVDILRPLFDTHVAHSSIVEQLSIASRLMVRTISKGGPPCWLEDNREEWLWRDWSTERQAAKQSQLSESDCVRLWLPAR